MEAPFPFLGSPPSIVLALRAAGAVSELSASTVNLGSGDRGRQLECLLQAGIVRAAPSGTYYLVEEAWARRWDQQRRRIVVGATALIVGIVLMLVVVGIWRR